MTKTMTALGVAAVLALGACGGGDDESGAATTTTERATTTTTAPPTPEEAFSQDVGRQLTFGASEAEGVAAALGSGQTMCDGLATNRGVLTDDAPADTPESDDAVVASMDTFTISLAFSGDAPDDAVAVILRAAAEHLCPEYTTVVEDYLSLVGL